MAWQSFAISEYRVHAVSHNTPGYGGVYGFIYLYWGGRQQATLWFYRDSVTTIPPNSSSGSAGSMSYYGRFAATQFHDSVDLLRNEKPVYFHWNDTSMGVWLATSQEPVGEAELP